MTLSLQKPAPGSGRRERFARRLVARRETDRQMKRDRLNHALAIKKLRTDAYMRDKGQCRAFGIDVALVGAPSYQAEMHHITPKSAGGLDTLENVCILSPKTHDMRHAGLLDITGDGNGVLYLTEKDKKGQIVRTWESQV